MAAQGTLPVYYYIDHKSLGDLPTYGTLIELLAEEGGDMVHSLCVKVLENYPTISIGRFYNTVKGIAAPTRRGEGKLLMGSPLQQ